MLVVAPQPFYEDRGTPIAVRMVLRALEELAIEADLLTFPVGIDPDLGGVRIFRCANPWGIRSVPIGFSGRKVLLDITLVLELRRRLRRERYRCLHAVEEAAFPAVLLGRRSGIPVVYDMQSSLPEQLASHGLFRNRPAQRLLRRCERWLLRHATCVMSSTGLAERVRALAPDVPLEEWRYPAELERPSPHSVAARRREFGLPADARIVLYAGNFAPYQGLPALLAAAPLVRERVPEATFVLVGGSPPPLVPAEHESFVRLLPRRPRSEMAELLAVADVLVSPRSEGANLPLKIFDYLAAARPIVATDIPAHRTVLHEHRSVLVKPTPEALAEGIVRVLRDPGLAARLAAAGRAYSRENLGWPVFVASVAAIHRRAITR